jgi:hypothetical protein
MDRAQGRFRAQGLRVPSYIAVGHHDSLVQGNEDGTGFIETIATGFIKPLLEAIPLPPRAPATSPMACPRSQGRSSGRSTAPAARGSRRLG